MDSSMVSSNSSDSTMVMLMMVPYLHFTPGDSLYFKSWNLSSSGAIVGACIGLFSLSILERWLSAMRGVFEQHWRHRATILAFRNSFKPCESSVLPHDAQSPVEGHDESIHSTQNSITSTSQATPKWKRRTIVPFIPSHDIPRGILHALQALLGYLLMLALMTFHAGLIISIILGLGVGEILFGRIGDTHSRVRH